MGRGRGEGGLGAHSGKWEVGMRGGDLGLSPLVWDSTCGLAVQHSWRTRLGDRGERDGASGA